jgi:hypothetical protein
LELVDPVGTWEIAPETVEPWRSELTAWWEEHERLKSAPLSKPKERVFEEAMSIDADEHRRIEKAAADEDAGLRRLQQYADQGLAETPENARAVRDWLEKNLKGYWSVAGVDAAIQNLGPRGTNTLRWKPKQPPVQTPPAQPTVRVLSNGETELPIDATEQQMRRASVLSLKDLAARRREGQTRIGWSGAKF